MAHVSAVWPSSWQRFYDRPTCYRRAGIIRSSFSARRLLILIELHRFILIWPGRRFVIVRRSYRHSAGDKFNQQMQQRRHQRSCRYEIHRPDGVPSRTLAGDKRAGSRRLKFTVLALVITHDIFLQEYERPADFGLGRLDRSVAALCFGNMLA